MKNNNNNNKTIIFTDRKYHVRRLKSVGIYPIYPPKRRMTIYRIVTIYNIIKHIIHGEMPDACWNLLCASFVYVQEIPTTALLFLSSLRDSENWPAIMDTPDLYCYTYCTPYIVIYFMGNGSRCVVDSDSTTFLTSKDSHIRREYIICIRYGVYYMYTDLQVVGWFEFII